MSVQIHSTAVVAKEAQLGTDVVIGPYCVVDGYVTLGDRTRLHSHAVVSGWTKLGADCEVFPFASVGNRPQDLKYKGEETWLLLGARNTVRECATLQPGTVQGGGKTVIGDGNLFMAYSHVAHDCVIGNNNIFANCAQLSGHVEIGNNVNIAGIGGIHQFCRVGDYAMAAAGSVVVQDIPPFCMVQGDRAHLRGLNVVGLKRRGFGAEQIAKIRAAYRTLFLSGQPTVEAAIAAVSAEGLLAEEGVRAFCDFVRASKRGVVRPLAGGGDAEA